MSECKTLQDSWLTQLLLLGGLILLVAVCVGGLDLRQTIELKQNMPMEDYSALFMNLFIITVIVERFITVFNAIRRRPGRLARLRELENAVDEAEKKRAQKEFDDYRARTRTLSMYAGFGLGILIGLAGVHTLQLIYEVSSLAAGFQKTLFQAIDIVVTAGLIAGGSKGLNAVTSLIGEHLDAVKAVASAQKPPNVTVDPD